MEIVSFGVPDPGDGNGGGDDGDGIALPTGDVGPVAFDLDESEGDQVVRQTSGTPSPGGSVTIDIAAVSGLEGAVG